MQVEQRQHLSHLRRLTRPSRQDRRGEPNTFSRHRIGALVVDPRLLHRHRTSRGRHRTGGMGAVAHHQPVAMLVDLTSVGLDVRGDLSQQRRRQHPPGAFTGELVQHVPTHRDRSMRVMGIVNYGEHERTFPNQRVNADPDQTCLGFRSCSGRCAPSRPPRRGPQVLVIAPSGGVGRVQRVAPPTKPSASVRKSGARPTRGPETVGECEEISERGPRLNHDGVRQNVRWAALTGARGCRRRRRTGGRGRHTSGLPATDAAGRNLATRCPERPSPHKPTATTGSSRSATV